MKSFSLSVFFPAYNEEANIAKSVEKATAAIQKLTQTYEIIVVNDGSKDKTGAIAEDLAKHDKHVKVIHHNPNQGYGAAVWSGIQASQYDYIFFTDADLQFDLEELKKLTQYIPEYPVVLGYRAKRQDPFMRLLNAYGWNKINRAAFGLKVRDIDCAFKLFRRDVVQNLPLKSKGAMMSAEMLIHLQRSGIKFKEVPVTHLPRTQGSPTGAKPSVIMRAFKELFQAYRGDLGSVTQKQIVKFAFIGVINTLIDLALYFVLTRYTSFFGDHLVTAKIVSFVIGSIFSFFANHRWTFRRNHPPQIREVAKFYFTVAVAVIINAGCVEVLLRIIDSDIVAVIIATFVTFIWNFVMSKFWVFIQPRK